MDGMIRHQILGKCLRKTKDTFNRKHEWKKVSREEMIMQNIGNDEHISREVFDLLKKYKLPATIFNCCNLEVFGFCHLYQHDVDTAVKNGCRILEVD
jgi:hypothetical protein